MIPAVDEWTWTEKAYLLAPMAAAFLYAIGAMGAKAARQRGLDTIRITLVANWVTALIFVGFLRPAEGLISDPWWPPVALAALFIAGQGLTFLALSRGDVSLATPLMGTKVVMVALLLATVFSQPVALNTWIGAIIAVAGIVALQASSRGGHFSHKVLTFFSALGAAACFACFDSMVQVWSNRPGVGYARLVPVGIILGAVAFTAILPLAAGTWRSATQGAYGFLAIGTGLIGLQSLILITAISRSSDAAGCNIVYGSRGMWSVALIYLGGRHFGNSERHAGGAMLIWRLIGSALILVAIVLAFQ